MFDFENNISARLTESLVQIELLVTLEEYCGGEGVFEGGDGGAAYSMIFSHVLMALYEQEIIGEDAFLHWEAAKQSDDEEDKVRVQSTTHVKISVFSLAEVPVRSSQKSVIFIIFLQKMDLSFQIKKHLILKNCSTGQNTVQ